MCQAGAQAAEARPVVVATVRRGVPAVAAWRRPSSTDCAARPAHRWPPRCRGSAAAAAGSRAWPPVGHGAPRQTRACRREPPALPASTSSGTSRPPRRRSSRCEHSARPDPRRSRGRDHRAAQRRQPRSTRSDDRTCSVDFSTSISRSREVRGRQTPPGRESGRACSAQSVARPALISGRYSPRDRSRRPRPDRPPDLQAHPLRQRRVPIVRAAAAIASRSMTSVVSGLVTSSDAGVTGDVV